MAEIAIRLQVDSVKLISAIGTDLLFRLVDDISDLHWDSVERKDDSQMRSLDIIDNYGDCGRHDNR